MSEEAIQEEAFEPEAEAEAIEESGEEGEIEASSEEGDSDVQADTVDELQDEIEEAIEDGATEEEVKSMIEEFELKVKGRTVTKTLDWSDKEAVKRVMQEAAAGKISMQEKAELENALRSKVSDWKQNPWAFFEEMGLDPDELAEMRMAQKLEEMKKDPAELERERQQAELQDLRDQLKAKEEREEQAKYEKLQEEAAMFLDNEISDALDAHSTLTATPRVIRQIADTMAWAITPEDQGGAGYDPDDISVNDILPTVEKEIRNEISQLFADLPESAIEEYIGAKGLEKLKKKAINKVKKAPKSAKALTKATAHKPKEKTEKKKKGNLDSFFSVRNR
jgi:hypothetical protein